MPSKQIYVDFFLGFLFVFAGPGLILCANVVL